MMMQKGGICRISAGESPVYGQNIEFYQRDIRKI
jgi:hypothetical protein